MNADSTLASYLRNVCPDADLSGVSSEALAFAAAMDVVGEVAPEIAGAIASELADQRVNLKLIASENFASPATLLAMGNWLSDKYAEGSPGHRFYAGCDNVDTIESRAVELAKGLFGADHAYVQPHSGIDANLVAFWAILTKRVEGPVLERAGAKDLNALSDADWESLRRDLGNQRLLGMALDSGGHLTHGFRPNVSGKLFEIARYTVDPTTGLLDYDEVRKQAESFRPLILLAGYSSYPRKINFRIFREIADEVGAVLMVDMAHFAGLVAGKVFTGDFDPVAHAQVVTTTTHKTLRGPRGGMVLCAEEFAATVDTGGTDNHLLLVDARPYGLTGRQAETALREAGITLNRNVIPFDPNGSWYTSGLRLGTPAVTTLGMGADEMREVAAIVHTVLESTEPVPDSKAKYQLDPTVRDQAKRRAADLLDRFPLYPGIAL